MTIQRKDEMPFRATNPLEEAMDRMWEAEQEHRRRKDIEETGIGKISYKNGMVIFTPIKAIDFYKEPSK